MKFYSYRDRPVAETAGHVIAWLTPRRPWIEVPPAVLKKATELTCTEWTDRFREPWLLTIHSVEEACTHLAMVEVLKQAAAKMREPQ